MAYFRDVSNRTTLADAQQIGSELNIDIKRFPSRSRDKGRSLQEALDYFTTGDGRAVQEKLGRQYNNYAESIYWLATRVYMVSFMYGHSKAVGDEAVAAIMRTCRSLALPQNVWGPFVETVRNASDLEDINKAAFDMDSGMITFLDSDTGTEKPRPR